MTNEYLPIKKNNCKTPTLGGIYLPCWLDYKKTNISLGKMCKDEVKTFAN
ncbi:hypothetical protein [Nodularia sphaerocarpa]|nr:hypothetical protein [Nodularia sphaerocarpa]